MKILENVNIPKKILFLVVMISLIGVAGAFYSSWNMKQIEARYSFMLDSRAASQMEMARVSRGLATMGHNAHKVAHYGGAADEAISAEAEYREMKDITDARFDMAAALLPEQAAELERFRLHLTEISALLDPAIAFVMQNEKAKAFEKIGQGDALITVAIEEQRVWLDDQKTANIDATNAMSAEIRNVIILGVAGQLAALLAGIAAALFVSSKGITGPLNKLGERMKTLAAGDLTVEVEGQQRKDEVGIMARAVQVFKEAGIRARDLEVEANATRDAAKAERLQNQLMSEESAQRQAAVVEALAAGLDGISGGDLTVQLTDTFPADYAKLQTDFNGAVGQLREAMTAVVSNVSTIRSGSEEIAHASDELSKRTEQQAASLEETAAALEEITATVKRTAEGSQHAAEAVASARGDAKQSGEVVQRAITAMGEIEKSSAEISQIIGVIDEIAFQTNLLALNAGVAAARAGDAGRGFAVVAQEVRALAQRSAGAAKEIKSLILTSGQQVRQGVTLVGETGESLSRIVDQVATIDGLVSEISASAQEQASALMQVNTAISHMDQMVQQNAAMVEESTAATHSLNSEAGELNTLVSRFKVGDAPAAQRSNVVHAAQTRIESAVRPSSRTTPSIPPRPVPRVVGNTALQADEWEAF